MKQLLEAINRGIKFALDDFDDQEEIQGHINSKVKYQGGTKEWLDLMNDVVDLGLPSGTLWCKHNLGCDYELLEYNPEKTELYDWYGNYYAWGELFSYTYKKNAYTYKDNPIQLPPEHDIATYTLGNYYSIPTKE